MMIRDMTVEKLHVEGWETGLKLEETTINQ